jgi:NADP-dependent 3-hydroxy acid dehydrogenase YdfG
MSGAFTGRHALVTGAGQGIGAAIARMLSAEGASVTLLGRRREPLEMVAASLTSATTIVTADVADEHQVSLAFSAARVQRGALEFRALGAHAGGEPHGHLQLHAGGAL